MAAVFTVAGIAPFHPCILSAVLVLALDFHGRSCPWHRLLSFLLPVSRYLPRCVTARSIGPWRRPCIDGTEMMAMTTRAMMLRTLLRMQWHMLSVADSPLYPDRFS